jgi:hypothetical protein
VHHGNPLAVSDRSRLEPKFCEELTVVAGVNSTGS